MAAAGRGRGRGRGFLSKEAVQEAISSPGGGAVTATQVSENGISSPSSSRQPSASGDGVAEIQEILARVSLEIGDEDLDAMLQQAENAACDEATLQKMTDLIYEKCVSDREFAKTGAFICDKLVTIETNGTKFRSLLLGKIQTDYKDKDQLRAKSVSKFLNVVSFMCQIFGTMRTAGGEVFKPLVGPIYECMNLILDSRESDGDEYECLNDQLQSVGRDLEQNDREKMEAFMEKIRLKIIKNGASPQIRCALLEIIECHCHGWKNLSNNVTRFYCDTMMDILTD